MIYASVIGLCSTCNNILSCFFRKRHGQPVWYCEQFDNSDYTVENRIDYSNALTKDIEDSFHVNEESFGVNAKEANQFEGLCSNCENRESCSLPKRDSGAWYCEEYQ